MAADQMTHFSILALSPLAQEGTRLVSQITQYLSTLPTPVDVLEDMASLVAVISSLLTSLKTTVIEYQVSLTNPLPFVRPLCEDVTAAFEDLRFYFEEAMDGAIFEPDQKGLVRTPRFAWFDVVGGERPAVLLRSRLCVEKYRVRVLIDAVRYRGLKGLSRGVLDQEQTDELGGLREMLPIIAVRLAGAHEDYVPRIHELLSCHREEGNGMTGQRRGLHISDLKDNMTKEQHECVMQKLQKSCTSSSNSIASCATMVADDSIEEAWLLRRTEPEKDLKRTWKVLGVKFSATYQHKAPLYYVKALPASVSEIREMRQSALGDLTQVKYERQFKKTILAMDNKAQKTIQQLLEARDKASSTDNIKRNWDVVTFQPRPRRKICQPREKNRWNMGKKPLVEWVMILKGTTVDHQERVTPAKHENPWKRAETKQCPIVHGRAVDVLTHVQKREFMTVEDAEKKVDVMMQDLFVPECDSKLAID